MRGEFRNPWNLPPAFGGVGRVVEGANVHRSGVLTALFGCVLLLHGPCP